MLPALVVAAVCLSFFEMLPIDFRHSIAPSIVSYEDVFFASQEGECYDQTIAEYLEHDYAMRQPIDRERNYY